MDVHGELQILERIRSLEKAVSKIPDLEEVVSGIQKEAVIDREQIDSIAAEVRLQLSTKDEENRALRYRADPYSNDGDSLTDFDLFEEAV